MRHEMVSKNPDIEVRFFLSVDEGSYVTPHWHESYELLYVLEGNIKVVVENREVTLEKENFIIINSRMIHSVLSNKNKALVLQIPKEVFLKYVPTINQYYFEIDMYPKDQRESTKLEKLRKILQDMQVVYDIQPEGYILKFNSLLYDLLFTLLHSYSKKITNRIVNKNERNLRRIDEIMDYLKEHYAQKCTISEIANVFGYSEDYLSHFFKKQTGITITKYLYAYRISKVYEQLIYTEKPIQLIMEENGCSNHRIAMRVFKEIYGCTPREKRKHKSDSMHK